MGENLTFVSNAQEIDRFTAAIAKSGRKRGPDGAMTTAMSMMAACSDLMSFIFGADDGRKIMTNALNQAFDQHAAMQSSAHHPQADEARAGGVGGTHE